MRTSLQDLIATCPNQLEANSIIVYDWCNWIVTEIPDGITCEDVLWCVDCEFILSLINFREWLIVDWCTISVSPERLNTNITATFDCNTGELVVGTTTMDLSCIADLFSFSFTDGLNTEVVNNGEQIFVQGLHGLQMVVWANLLQIDLPSGGTNGQVLTWDATSETAYRANITTLCCDRVYDCMNPIVAWLQNQINIIAGQLCPCGGEGTPLSVYEEGLLVMGSVSMINIIGDCLTATANIGTNHMVDITLDISATFDDGTNTLTICGTDVDLSALAPTINNITIGDWTSLYVADVLIFDPYFTITQPTPGIDTYNISLDLSGSTFTCEQDPGNPLIYNYSLSILWQTIDMSCIFTSMWWVQLREYITVGWHQVFKPIDAAWTITSALQIWNWADASWASSVAIWPLSIASWLGSLAMMGSTASEVGALGMMGGTASWINSVSIGAFATAAWNSSVAFWSTTSNGTKCMTTWRVNVWYSDSLFEIGSWSTGSKANVFTVFDDWDVEIDDNAAFYVWLRDVDWTRRFTRSGNDLIFARRELWVYVTKQTISA